MVKGLGPVANKIKRQRTVSVSPGNYVRRMPTNSADNEQNSSPRRNLSKAHSPECSMGGWNIGISEVAGGGGLKPQLASLGL